MSGRWVTVTMADGTSREDWVPVDQPASPDGAPGRWHVVTPHAGAESVWEWHGVPAPALPPRPGQAPPPRVAAPPYAPSGADEWAPPRRAALDFLPRWRVLSWVILILNVLMLILLIAAIASSSQHTNTCSADFKDTCNSAEDAGTAIGVALVIIMWAACDVILGVVWMITNRSNRSCPACGSGVKKGHIACRRCGHDFRTVAGRGY